MEFVYESLPVRVLFGSGKVAALGAEVERLECSRVMVLCTPRGAADARRVAAAGGLEPVAVFDQARVHVPRAVLAGALASAGEHDAELFLAIGGGSAIGLAKALARATGRPSIAVPTTYAGSEMTDIYGISDDDGKTTGRSAVVRPKAVIYDPELTLSLPPEVSGPSGLNAAAHAVEALYAHDSNPITRLVAEEALRALAASLPEVVVRPDDLGSRIGVLYGAWLASMSLATTSMALHHKLCHVLGGRFDLPHAELHSVLLPHVTAFNAPAASGAMARIARALGVDDAARGLHDLGQRVGAPASLRVFDLTEAQLAEAAGLAVKASYPNPRPFTAADIEALLQRAWRGEPPSSDMVAP